ncbi:MAG: rhomboid family intramembrane serine protease [Gemmatimonadales bacterium]
MTPWVFRLLLANALAFLLQSTMPAVTALGALSAQGLLWRPWSLITYMFLHGSFGHIFWNMFGLYIFGPVLESRLGGANFIRLYLASGIVGGLIWLAFSALPVGGFGVLIGASGAVFGIQLGFAYFWPRQPIYIWGVFPIEARWLVVIMTVASLYFGTGGRGGNVAHFAHLGGFLGGFLYLKWMERRQQGPLKEWQSSLRPSAPKLESATKAIERWSKIRRDNLHEVNRAELDRILDKIGASGIASLSQAEREFLDRFSSQLH